MTQVGEMRTQVVIVGGGVGGVAAALALANLGVRCVVIEPTAWIGGQLTSQAVPPDENRWVESFGSTCAYREFRGLVRSHYRAHESLSAEAAADPLLNPGGGWVSRLCCAPRVAHAVLRGMLAGHESAGRVTVLTGHRLEGAEAEADRVRGVSVRTPTGASLVIWGELFLEASETGDLLELAGIEHRVGAESQGAHGELHGLAAADASCQQPPSWCFAMEHRPGESHVIDRPEGYGELSRWVPVMHDRAWPGPLLSWVIPTHNAEQGAEGVRTLPLVPWPDEPASGAWELWRYRRIVRGASHTDGRPEVCLVNWVQMDDWRVPMLTVPRPDRERAYARCRQLSRCLLYWMQTEAPRHDGGVGYPGLRLRGDELGTADGFAMAPYIREPRRLEAVRMLHEGDIGSMQRGHLGAGVNGVPAEGRCEPFADAAAIGHYHIDLHPTPTGRNSVYVEAAPFQIPLRSLVPVRAGNVLAAGKCLGVTHIANGATRMHAVEWSVGEAAGVAAAVALRAGGPVQALGGCGPAGRALAAEVRGLLASRGAPTAWPWDPPVEP
jgi:choline dehydrogenase-like flavoprotein